MITEHIRSMIDLIEGTANRVPMQSKKFEKDFRKLSNVLPNIQPFLNFYKTASIVDQFNSSDSPMKTVSIRRYYIVPGKFAIIYKLTNTEIQLCLIVGSDDLVKRPDAVKLAASSITEFYPFSQSTEPLRSMLPPKEKAIKEKLTPEDKQKIVEVFYDLWQNPDDLTVITNVANGNFDDFCEYAKMAINKNISNTDIINCKGSAWLQNFAQKLLNALKDMPITPLSSEQASRVIAIFKDLYPDVKDARAYIDSMSPEDIEDFLELARPTLGLKPNNKIRDNMILDAAKKATRLRLNF